MYRLFYLFLHLPLVHKTILSHFLLLTFSKKKIFHILDAQVLTNVFRHSLHLNRIQYNEI